MEENNPANWHVTRVGTRKLTSIFKGALSKKASGLQLPRKKKWIFLDMWLKADMITTKLFEKNIIFPCGLQ